MSENTQNNKSGKGNEKRKKMILIPLHVLAFIGIAILIIALINAENKVTQITMIPTPGPVETLPEETVPLANGTVTPALTSFVPEETATPVVTPTPAESTATSTPDPAATATPRPTNRPTPTRPPVTTPTPSQPSVTTPTPSQPPVTTPTPSQPPVTTPTPAHTPEPTPEFTYSVSAKQGVAPAGYMIVSVVVEPAGNYTVTYDGQVMDFNGSKYYLTVQALGEGESYRSHVKIRKN